MTLKLAWPFQKSDYFRLPEMKTDANTFIVYFISL